MRIRVADTTLFFDVHGAALVPEGNRLRRRPTLILLHGGPGFDHATFKPHFFELADAAQVVYLDHRGHGRSDWGTADEWTLARWADDVHEFCRALDIDRPVIYGLSFGGMVAQAYASRHPDHPGGLILDSTGPRIRLDLAYAAFEALGGAEARRVAEWFWGNPDDPDAWNAYLAVCMPLYSRVPADPVARERSILRGEPLQHFFGKGGEGHRFDFRNSLREVRCPVLVLSGKQDPIIPPALIDELVEALPAASTQLVRYADAGHGVFRDRPDDLYPLVRRWLTENVPESV